MEAVARPTFGRHCIMSETVREESNLTRTWDQRLVLRLYDVLAFVVPLSVKLYFVPFNLEVIFPAEPLLALLALLLVYGLVRRRPGSAIPSSTLRRPLVLTAIVFFCIIAVSGLFSTMHLVSLKAVIVRSVYMLVLFFGLLRTDHWAAVDPRRLLVIHALSFTLVLLYATWREIGSGFSRAGSVHVSFPFYADHTIYAAALVFVLVLAGMHVFLPQNRSRALRWAWWTLAVALILGCYATFCRAAWLSVVVALAGAGLFALGLRWRGFATLLAISLVVALSLGKWFLHEAPLSLVDSNADKAGWKEAVLSIPNVHTDTSNKERVNRWLCAMRMGQDRPWTGFGPGTYQFRYIPYQRESWLTYLSWQESMDPGATLQSAWQLGPHVMVKSADQLYYYCGGTAHSEYFLALAELGVPGALAFLALLACAAYAGLRALGPQASPEDRCWLAIAMLSLFAYAVHALFNNYLDDCKLAFLFWGSIALIARGDAQRGSIPRSRSRR